MNKYTPFLNILTAFLIASSCNQPGTGSSGALVKSKADTLFDEVMDGHNIGMANMGPLTRAEQEATRVLDSLRILPAKVKEASMPFQIKVESLLDELKQANQSMDKWMNEFEIDSFTNNTEERIKYLSSEKSKVTKVKDAILSSIRNADTLFQKKFKQ